MLGLTSIASDSDMGARVDEAISGAPAGSPSIVTTMSEGRARPAVGRTTISIPRAALYSSAVTSRGGATGTEALPLPFWVGLDGPGVTGAATAVGLGCGTAVGVGTARTSGLGVGDGPAVDGRGVEVGVGVGAAPVRSTAADGEDGGESPSAFLATIVNVYEAPRGKPRIVTDLEVPPVTAMIPFGLDVTT
jgi:hypothetical protein